MNIAKPPELVRKEQRGKRHRPRASSSTAIHRQRLCQPRDASKYTANTSAIKITKKTGGSSTVIVNLALRFGLVAAQPFPNCGDRNDQQYEDGEADSEGEAVDKQNHF